MTLANKQFSFDQLGSHRCFSSPYLQESVEVQALQVHGDQWVRGDFPDLPDHAESRVNRVRGASRAS